MAEVLQLLRAPAATERAGKGVFNTVLSFTDDDVQFTPNEQAVLEVINTNVVEGVLSVVQSSPRILVMRAFAALFKGRPSGLNAVSIIRSMPHFVYLRQAINQAIEEDYAAAYKYSVVSAPR